MQRLCQGAARPDRWKVALESYGGVWRLSYMVWKLWFPRVYFVPIPPRAQPPKTTLFGARNKARAPRGSVRSRQKPRLLAAETKPGLRAASAAPNKIMGTFHMPCELFTHGICRMR